MQNVIYSGWAALDYLGMSEALCPLESMAYWMRYAEFGSMLYLSGNVLFNQVASVYNGVSGACAACQYQPYPVTAVS